MLSGVVVVSFVFVLEVHQIVLVDVRDNDGDVASDLLQYLEDEHENETKCAN